MEFSAALEGLTALSGGTAMYLATFTVGKNGYEPDWRVSAEL